MDRCGIRIGKVSEQTGVTVDTIRFYEKLHLLDRARRTQGGFRVFNAGDVGRITFIRSAQQLGFSLEEIRELIVLQGNGAGTCTHVRDLLQSKVASVRNRIRELGRLEEDLVRQLRRCEKQLKVSGDSHCGGCPVLVEIAKRGSR